MSVQTDEPRFLVTPLTSLVIEPVTLEGQYVRLEPLSITNHLDGLVKNTLDEEIWRYMQAPVQNSDEMRAYIETALKGQQAGNMLPFATIYKPTNEVIGSTRYMNIDKPNRHVEIGSTFVGKDWQRTKVNTEAKYLMLTHAFETLGCIRVEFKTDSLNMKSRNALLRIGAKYEGIFRNHMICSNGRIRHSVYFAIADEEWPTVKADLEAKLARTY